jgi:hypothetical protein
MLACSVEVESTAVDGGLKTGVFTFRIEMIVANQLCVRALLAALNEAR